MRMSTQVGTVTFSPVCHGLASGKRNNLPPAEGLKENGGNIRSTLRLEEATLVTDLLAVLCGHKSDVPYALLRFVSQQPRSSDDSSP
jgi:aryl-alcohol dehydrogenase-like predicted oxidoreductase